MKRFFKCSDTYKEMTAQYNKTDGIIAIAFYVLLLATYAISGMLYSQKGLFLSAPMNLLLMGVCIAIVLLRHQKLDTIGFTMSNIGKSALLGLVFGMVIAAFNVIPALLSGKEMIGIGALLYNIFFYFIVIALNEEIIFRGYIQTRLYSLIQSDVIVTILGGLMFGMMHIPFQMFMRNQSLLEFLKTNYWMVVIPFMWHFVFNFLYRKYNSIVAPTIFHGFMNFTNTLFF